MSELTKCNWCTLGDFIDNYGKQNIVLQADEGWICVMLFHPSVVHSGRSVTEIDYARVGAEENEDWDHVASFKQLTVTCVC